MTSTPQAARAPDLGDRVAVVTGASSGIGAATARLLAAQGFRVVCAARRAERVEALADEVGGVAVACDVTREEDVARLVRAAGDRVHVLVNNAGGALGLEPVAQADVELWQQMYETNVLGTLRVTKALLPALVAADGEGVVVNVGSIAGFLAYEGGHVGYCVLPDQRRRGHASEMLRQAVVLMRARGVERILVTCDDDNVASAGVIEACGGVYESTVEGRGGIPKRRYWIG